MRVWIPAIFGVGGGGGEGGEGMQIKNGTSPRGTDESTLDKDSSVPLMNYDSNDHGS